MAEGKGTTHSVRHISTWRASVSKPEFVNQVHETRWTYCSSGQGSSYSQSKGGLWEGIVPRGSGSLEEAAAEGGVGEQPASPVCYGKSKNRPSSYLMAGEAASRPAEGLPPTNLYLLPPPTHPGALTASAS
jgi:hypothetical protein